MNKNSIYFDSIPTIYPDSKNLDIKEVKPPEDLADILAQTEKVQRFDNPEYHLPGVILDTTLVHTLRCVYRARTIPYKSKTVERLLWLHDIPERTDVQDVDAVERFNNEKVAQKVEINERMYAKSIFSEKDYVLYEQFQLAENLTMGFEGKCPDIPEALIAKVIDVIDGNLTFTYFITRWLKKNKYNDIPQSKSFQFSMQVYNITMRKMKECVSIDTKAQEIIEYLFKSEFSAQISMYSELDPSVIPKEARNQLKMMKALVD